MTEQLPWDRFTPDEVPTRSPNCPTSHRRRRLLPRSRRRPRHSRRCRSGHPHPCTTPRRALSDALDDLWPMLKEQAIGYAKDSWQEIRKGQTVDVLHPTITAEDKAGKQLVIADAKSRSWRTLIQGLIFDVFAAIVAAVALLSGADPFVQRNVDRVRCAATQIRCVSAVISYFMRLKITPTIKDSGVENGSHADPPADNERRRTHHDRTTELIPPEAPGAAAEGRRVTRSTNRRQAQGFLE